MAKFLDYNGLLYFWEKIKAKFVEKESGKGLSTNDFTTTLKDKLDGIEAGAQKNVKPDWSASSGSAAEILNKPTIPSKTSDLKNDSGFITTSDIPEGAAASTTVPKMDGTAAVGSELAFARGDHVHPSDTKKVNKSGDTMTGNLVMDNHKVTGLATPTENTDAATKSYVDTAVRNKADKSTTLSGYGITDAYTKTEIDGKGFLTSSSIANKADKATTLSGYGITDAYTKTQVDSKLSSVYKPAGSTPFASLPTPSASNLGNVYNVTDAFTTDERFIDSEPTQYPIGTNVVVVQAEEEYRFDVLAGFIDLSDYLKDTDMVVIQNSEIDTIVAS